MRRTTLLTTALVVPTLAFAGFNASSHKKPSRSGDTFEAASALDGDPATAWSIDPEEENKGQWIEVDVPVGKVDKLSVVVGWAKTDQTWIDYARVKTARVQVYNLDSGEPVLVHEGEATLEDKKDRQFIELPDVQVGGEMQGGRVRLTVNEVYEGKDYANLAMGELLVHMVEFDAKTVNITTPPSSEAEGHDAAMMNDESTRTYWATDGDGVGASFTMDGGRYSISSIGLVPGPTTHARPKVIEVTQSNVTKWYDVPKGNGPHWFDLPALVGYTGSAIGPVEVKIVEVYEGSSSQAVAVAEVKFKATGLDAW
jgi:hypothetical protein